MKAFNIQKVLIPIDFSETSLLAIEHGAFTAQLFKADLVLLHVVEKHWERFSITDPGPKVESLPNYLETIETKLDEVADNIKHKYGVSSTTITTSGNICPEVVKVAKENNVDLIVMGTHGVSGIEEFFIGSNAFKVVTMAHCPVISVQNHAQKLGFTEIVLPIDNSDHSRQKVNHAVQFAKHYGSTIHILGLLGNDDDPKKFEIKIDQVEDYIKKVGIAYKRKTVSGKNQSVLTLDYARQQNADLIMIMNDQESDFTGVFIGPYAQQIVNHSKIPVMSIKPEVHSENIPWVHPY